MKRCPQCNRAEADDALTFCRVDGTPLVRESGAVSKGAGTLRFSPEDADTSETRILPTGGGLSRPTAPTTVLEGHRASSGTRELSKLKPRRTVVFAVTAISIVALTASAYLYLSSGKGGAAIPSVAVLPFENASGSADLEYLSDGLSESLIDKLSQLSQLKVVNSTLKCNTQLFANAEVARLVKSSIYNMRKQLGQVTVVTSGSQALLPCVALQS